MDLQEVPKIIIQIPIQANQAIQNNHKLTQAVESSQKQKVMVQYVNTSVKLKENKVESGFEISNINFSEKDGHTSLEADVTNMTGTAQGNFMAEIVLLDKEGKEQGRIPVAISETQIVETVGIQAGINDQYANAYNFILEKK